MAQTVTTSDLYLRGAQFEPQPEHKLSKLSVPPSE
jgi:hypothetical protein